MFEHVPADADFRRDHEKSLDELRRYADEQDA
jgi:hypothetical protein